MENFGFILIWIIALSSIALMLARPRGIAESYWVCGGAALLVASGLIPWRQAALEGREVYLFLAGMMLLAELTREEGVFEWMADVAARHAKKSSGKLFTLIYLVGTGVTALLSNDATAVVLTPAVLAVVRKAKIEPVPYLLACALIANAASFVFPISNPANLVVFDGQMPALGAWLRIFLLPSVGAVAMTFFCLRWVSRKELRGDFPGEVTGIALSPEGKKALAGLIAAAILLIVASAMGIPLGLPTCAAAVLAMIPVMWRRPGIAWRVTKGASWSVVPLVAGLFVIVEALQDAGLLRIGSAGLRALEQAPAWLAKSAAAMGVAVLSNAMNNLPVALASGAAVQHAGESSLVAHAMLIGVDLGPNLSVSGSLATILWLIALRRENVEITAWEFFRVGLIAMPVALAASLLCLWR